MCESDALRLDDFASSDGPQWSGHLVRGTNLFPDGRPAATVSGTIETAALPADWRGYQTLRFELLNAGSEPVVGGLEILDREGLHSPDRIYGDYVDRRRSLLIPEGLTCVIVRINPIRTTRGTRDLDLSTVVQVALNLPDEGGPFAVSNLRLGGEGDVPDDASGAVPGDSVLVMDQLDIRCFTYRPDDYHDPPDIERLRTALVEERCRLAAAVRSAEINGKAVLYAHAALVVVDIALHSRPLLAWHFGPRARRDNYSGAISLAQRERVGLEDLLAGRTHEDDEDDSNLPILRVRPVPDIAELRFEGERLVDRDRSPVLLCSMGYHNEGELLRFFAPENHKLEIYAVGGGSRYDIEWSPVYEAFHRYAPATRRVGWQGWCGHLIKDQWAMGGRKENVVLCLENPHILDAIDEYNRLHADEWRHRSGLLYVILGYELTYLCYCAESLRRFREWLREQHCTVARLNAAWGTTYRSFDEATPPAAEDRAPAADANRAAWFDWAQWNARRFTDHLLWSRASVRKLHPTIPVCAGGSHSMTSPNNGTTGIDEELIINEVDDVILHEGNDLMQIDLFRSLADRPIPMVDPEQGGDCSGWLLNYLHGKSAICMFWWPKQPSRQFPRSTLSAPVHGRMSPAAIWEHLRRALDVRRLASEIVSFWSDTPQVALLYSRTSVLQVDPELMTGTTTPYLSMLRSTYESARCLDLPLGFISERQLLAGKAKRYGLLLIPSVRSLPAPVFDALDRYVAEGGNLVVIAESLLTDEYNRPADYLARWGICVERLEQPSAVTDDEYVQGYDQNLARRVTFAAGTPRRANRFHEWPQDELSLEPLIQRAGGAEVLAEDDEGQALLLRSARGKGAVWYVPGWPAVLSGALLLDRVIDSVGIGRPLRVRLNGAARIPGLEARLSRRTHDDLVYVANESAQRVDFEITTDRPVHEIRELRTMQYYREPRGSIDPGDLLIFSLREDPSVRVRSRPDREER